MAPAPRDDFLSDAEVTKLDHLFLEAVCAVEDVRRRHPLGKHLQRPKLPALLTEALAATVVPRIFPTAVARRPAVGRSDLVAEVLDPPSARLVAVKGTGAARWITLTATDMEADCLLWIDYTERIADMRGPVRVLVFDRRPLAEWGHVGRVTLQQAIRHYGAEPRRVVIDADRSGFLDLRAVRRPRRRTTCTAALDSPSR